MSCKRRRNVVADYAMEEETSSDEERSFDCDVSSSGRSAAPGRQQQDGGSVVSVDDSCDTMPRRRGRGVSKRPCLNRNAQMARENRQRKKEYLEKVENKLAFFRQENKNLSNVIQRQGIDLKRLKAEVSYLKNVLNNSSSITTLLKSMNDTLAGKTSNNNKDRCCAGNDGNGPFRRLRNDSGTSLSSEKHQEYQEDGAAPRSWNDDGIATWRRGGKYIDRGAASAHAIFPGNLKSQSSLGDSDHTYTTSRDGSCDEKLRNFGENDVKDDAEVFTKIAGDRFIGDFTTTGSLNFGLTGDIDDLPPFDANLFDSIGNDANAAPDTLEYFPRHNKDVDDYDDAGNMFQSLDNSGICLHVNSGKISLEFCSICHLNSINSTE